MRREIQSVLFFSGACLAVGARAEADPQLTALIAGQLQKVQGALEPAPGASLSLITNDADGVDLRWPWHRDDVPEAPLPDGIVNAPTPGAPAAPVTVAPAAPVAVVADSGSWWYLRNIWVRLRARGGFRVPGIVSVRAVPEIEMEWQRAFPKGWKQFEPAARR